MRRLCALLLLAAAVVAAHGREATTDDLEGQGRGLQQVRVARCGELPAASFASYDQLMRQGPGSRCSDFIKGVKDWKLTGVLRQACRGRVIVCPENVELQNKFIKMGLYKRPFDVPPYAKRAFRTYVQRGVCVRRSQIPARAGCGNMYVTGKIGNLNSRLTMIKPTQWALPARPKGGVRKADDAPTEFQYSVLGTGYNSYTGFPISYGMSSLDPGLTLTPLFELTPQYVRTLTNAYGGSCSSQFSTSTYNSAQNMKEAVSASLQISGNVSGITFSASASFSMVSQTSQTSQTITTSSGAKIYLGGYGLAAGPGGLVVSFGLKNNTLPLMQAASEDRYDVFALESFVYNYGTHYIKTVWYGGLASVINQMTAQSYSSLNSLGVKVNIAVQASMVQVSADVDYSKTQSNEVSSVSSTFSQVLIPSSVPIALTSSAVLDDPTKPPSPSFIDCVQWTNSLRQAAGDQGWKPPVHYNLAPIVGIFSFPNLFPSDWASVLPAMSKQVYRYMTTCGYTATDLIAWQNGIRADPDRYTACKDPPVPLAECVTGTYLTRSQQCNTCYGDGTVIGPNCNSTYTLSCTAYSCFCMPKYAKDTFVTSNFCINLNPNPPAPPAPSMSSLADKKKKL